MHSVTKTNEMEVDFRSNRTLLKKITIQGEEMQLVDDYKYLDVHLNNKLDWNCNTKAVYRKGQRLYFLRKLKSSVCVCVHCVRVFVILCEVYLL